MEPVSTVVGTAVPLPLANVDTDQIVPKQFLKRVERSGFGEFLFYDWARDAEGELEPSFVLNDPAYADGKILVAGPNFGSGSSREHAPWALEDWGFKAVIAQSFADIFSNNCTKIGVLPIVLSPLEVDALMELASRTPNTVTVDLNDQTVTAEGFAASFDIDPHTKHCLLHGLDDIALTLEQNQEIGGFEEERPAFKTVVR
ncbi:MAG: 3-isopropylmalate dehydratase small subunit [Acidimicrobiia bacterium]